MQAFVTDIRVGDTKEVLVPDTSISSKHSAINESVNTSNTNSDKNEKKDNDADKHEIEKTNKLTRSSRYPRFYS